jgi:hypothetical protein
MNASVAWPELDPASWAATKRHLHLYAQMLGKLRVALSPAQPNWMFTALLLTARGFTTGPLPWRAGAVQATLDVFASALIVETGDGRSRQIALVPARTVADVFAALHGALAELDVDVTLTPIPQELADVTPLDADTRPPAYEPAAVQRWFAVVTTTAGVFEAARAPFFGRTGIQLWWGALDLALLFFNGKHVPAPANRGYLLRYDLDAEMLNVGFYPGDENGPPFFYGYIYPQPDGAPQFAVPEGVSWSAALGEWVLPYDAVRTSADPAARLRSFVDTLYGLCFSAAGWDRDALTYAAPKRR